MKKYEPTANVEEPEEQDDDNSFFPAKRPRTAGYKAEAELARFLACPNHKLTSLSDFPLIKRVFIKHNVIFPSSACSERLFSSGKAIFRKNRHCLTDEHFEMHLLMRVNKYPV